MADEETTTEETTEVEETEESTEESTTEEETDESKVTEQDDWKAKSRKNESKAEKALKRAERAEAEVKKFKDADKSESEKLAEKATDAESRAAKAEANATRLEIAIDKGLTGKQARAFAKRLVGETQEELEEDADELLASFKPATSDEETEEESEEDNDPVKRRPTEKTKRTGATSRTEPDEMDPAKLADAIPTQGF